MHKVVYHSAKIYAKTAQCTTSKQVTTSGLTVLSGEAMDSDNGNEAACMQCSK